MYLKKNECDVGACGPNSIRKFCILRIPIVMLWPPVVIVLNESSWSLKALSHDIRTDCFL